jgi:RND family efflux transporter MFP subunit
MKKIKLAGIILLGLATGLTSCTQSAKKDTKTVTTLPNVTVKQVVERNVEQKIELTATIQPETKNSIAPSSPGRIRQVLVEVGNHVQKGQKLVQMDVANLSNLETQLDNYKRMYKRTQELFTVGGASQQELDNAKVQMDMAQTNLKNLTENTYLLSPISGIITAKNYDDGDMYSAQMPVLTVMEINPVKVIVNVSESFYADVKMGMPVKISFDVFPNQTFNGKVTLIYPTIDDRSRTFGVEIKLNNNNYKVRPGMFARVSMGFGNKKHVVVPDQAIIKQTGSGARFVFVYNNGKVEYKQVELGQRLGDEYELVSGISSGSEVVINGQSTLVDGSEVNVVK